MPKPYLFSCSITSSTLLLFWRRNCVYVPALSNRMGDDTVAARCDDRVAWEQVYIDVTHTSTEVLYCRDCRAITKHTHRRAVSVYMRLWVASGMGRASERARNLVGYVPPINTRTSHLWIFQWKNNNLRVTNEQLRRLIVTRLFSWTCSLDIWQFSVNNFWENSICTW